MVLKYGLCTFLARFYHFRHCPVYSFLRVVDLRETERGGVLKIFHFGGPPFMVCFGLKHVWCFLLLRLIKVSSKSFFENTLICQGKHTNVSNSGHWILVFSSVGRKTAEMADFKTGNAKNRAKNVHRPYFKTITVRCSCVSVYVANSSLHRVLVFF